MVSVNVYQRMLVFDIKGQCLLGNVGVWLRM